MSAVIDATVTAVMNEMVDTIVSQSNEQSSNRFAQFKEMGLIVSKDAVEQMEEIRILIIQALRVFQPQLVDFVENPPKKIRRSSKQVENEAEQFIENKLNRLLVQFKDNANDIQSIQQMLHSTDERKCIQCKRSKPLKYYLKANLTLPIKPDKLVNTCQICRSGRKRSDTVNPSKKTLWRTFWMDKCKAILYRPCIFCDSTRPQHLECDHMPNVKTEKLSKHSYWANISDANESCECFLTELLNMRAFLCRNCHSKISKTQKPGRKRKPPSSDPKVNKQRKRVRKIHKKYYKAACNFRINLKTGTLEPHLLERLQKVITGKIGECRYCKLRCTRQNVGCMDFNHIFPEKKTKGRKGEYAAILSSLVSNEKRMQKLEYEARKAGCEQVCHECHRKVTAEQNALN